MLGSLAAACDYNFFNQFFAATETNSEPTNRLQRRSLSQRAEQAKWVQAPPVA